MKVVSLTCTPGKQGHAAGFVKRFSDATYSEWLGYMIGYNVNRNDRLKPLWRVS